MGDLLDVYNEMNGATQGRSKPLDALDRYHIAELKGKAQTGLSS